ncbi:MAG: hypothetical protein AABX32_01060 [Nanoarchaeota archaeon]
MANVSLETIHKELADIKGDLKFLKHIMKEEYELSGWSKKELAESRKVPDSDLISHEEVRKRILGK